MQTRRQLLQEWDQQLRALLPGVRVTQVAVLACLSLGLLWSGRVTLGAVAASLPLRATDASVVRRLRRWLANPRVAVGRLWPPLLTPLLARWAGRDLLLVLDPTPLDERLSLLLRGLVVHKRILPVWSCPDCVESVALGDRTREWAGPTSFREWCGHMDSGAPAPCPHAHTPINDDDGVAHAAASNRYTRSCSAGER